MTLKSKFYPETLYACWREADNYWEVSTDPKCFALEGKSIVVGEYKCARRVMVSTKVNVTELCRHQSIPRTRRPTSGR